MGLEGYSIDTYTQACIAWIFIELLRQASEVEPIR